MRRITTFGLLLFFLLLITLSGTYGQEMEVSGDGSGEGSGMEGSGSGSGDDTGGKEVEETLNGDDGSGEDSNDDGESGSGEDSNDDGESGSGDSNDDDGESGSGEAEEEESAEEASGDDDGCTDEGSCANEEDSGEASSDEDGSGDEASGEEEEASGDEETTDDMSGSDALALELGSCDVEGMDEKLAGCLNDYQKRIETLEQELLSSSEDSDDDSALEEKLEAMLVKMKVVDCQNDTQCDDDKKCMQSLMEPAKILCESPCDREQCLIMNSECVVRNHTFSCECKEGFHGNATEFCVPDGFTSEDNGKHYKIFDSAYVEWENATEQCHELGARLPVLDSKESITVIKKYLETSNFTVFEQWDRSSRRIWLGLVMERGYSLQWADGSPISAYPASSQIFVWEARRFLSQEAQYADNRRHYGLYIDGDIAKLPGGGRKGAAVLCELIIPKNGGNTGQDRGAQRYPNYPGSYNNRAYYPRGRDGN